jgi:hypothetical protein
MKILKLLPVFILLFSCKKTEIPDSVIGGENSNGIQIGLPAELSSIHGYLYASYNSSSLNNRRLTTYAAFGDPERNLMGGFNHYEEQTIDIGTNRGNVSVGSNVFFSGYYTNISYSGSNPNSSAYYFNYSRNIGTLNAFATWKFDGNKSFKGQDISVPRGFPKLNDSLIKPFDTITINKGYSVKTENRFSNYDSITVNLASGFGSNVELNKTFAAGVTVTLSASELTRFSQENYVYIFFKAYNYSNQIIEGKKLVYELSGVTNQKTLRIIP